MFDDQLKINTLWTSCFNHLSTSLKAMAKQLWKSMNIYQMCPQYRHVKIEHVFFSRTLSRHIDFHTDFWKSLHSGMSSAAIHFPTNMIQPIHSKHCANNRAEFGGAYTLSWSLHENKHCKWNQLRSDKRTSLILILLRSCSVHRVSKRLLLALPCTTKRTCYYCRNE